MAELLPLDKAAAQVGKSEVTLRRLIKAGRIPFQKEKTLTGFVYRVDPEQVRGYYKVREGALMAEDLPEIEEEKVEKPVAEEVLAQPKIESTPVAQTVRVAIAGESGDLYEYWQKKSDLYEERYNQEVSKHSQTREELGVWRGRAEQAQSMLMKMLPSGEVEVKTTPAEPIVRAERSSPVLIVLGTIIVVLAVVAAFVVLYLRLPH